MKKTDILSHLMLASDTDVDEAAAALQSLQEVTNPKFTVPMFAVLQVHDRL